MPRGTIRKTCPTCQGTNTKRHSILVLKKVTLEGAEPRGIQRWYCKDCRKSWTPPHADSGLITHTLEVHERATMLYFDQGASYRAVARELGRLGIRVDGKRCWSMVQRLASNCKAPWEVSVELKPKWSGWIAVDGDSLPLGTRRESALLGVDLEVLDIPHAILAEEENGENWLFYFLVLKHVVGYPFRGVVSDGDPGIEAAVRLACPGLPHQLCVKHFQDGLHRYLRYEFGYRYGNQKEIERFEEQVRGCLYASILPLAEERLTMIRADAGFKRARLDGPIAILEQNWNRLTQHFHHPGLMRTSNAAEGVIRKLDRRLDAMDSFADHGTAWNTLKMLLMHTRFRVLTDCRGPNRHRNGFSPLQLAGIDTRNMNWIRWSQKANGSDKRKP